MKVIKTKKKTTLIIAKTCVALTKALSTPRLESKGTVLGSRLGGNYLQLLDDEYHKKIFFYPFENAHS